MFFKGSLQDGIALALEQSKVVVCFIKGANGQSTQWADEYFDDDEIITHVGKKAIALEMDNGSTEAGYLAAFYPVSTSPTLVVINKGQLLADIHGDVDFPHFKQSLLRALDGEITEGSVAQVATATQSHDGAESAVQMDSGSRATQPNSPASVDPAVQIALNERRRRFEVDKKDRDTAERAERQAKIEAQRAAAEAAAPDFRLAKQLNYAALQKKRQQDERSERERILKVIENDKAERRYKEELRKAQAQSEIEVNDAAESLVNGQLFEDMKQLASTSSTTCALQVRLFDGSTMRSTFPSEQTLGTQIRQWIEEQRTGSDTPYTFKQILTPMLNRSISISDEQESLRSLGLAPSATLVMVPIQTFTAAYVPRDGYLTKGLSAAYNVFSGGVSLISGTIGTFLGISQEPARTSEGGPAATTRGHEGSGINIRTLRDRHIERDEQQLYNGNQLNFEPRKDDESKDE